MSNPPKHSHSHSTDELDDIDRLFLGRLDRAEVPDDFTGRVLASTVARTEATRVILAWPWLAAGLLAFGLLTLAGYQLGVRLAMSDGVDLVNALFADLGLLATSPGDVLAALGEVIPWWLMAVAAVSAALLVVAVENLVARVPAGLRQHAAG